MDLILDTCGLLSLAGTARRKLTRKTLSRIRSADLLHVSACSLFEIALKLKRGQIKLSRFESASAFWDEAVNTYDIEPLPVQASDFFDATQLPDHHADPFDRIIMAQALRLNCVIVTYDEVFEAYRVQTID